jgi:hypothetical protein
MPRPVCVQRALLETTAWQGPLHRHHVQLEATVQIKRLLPRVQLETTAQLVQLLPQHALQGSTVPQVPVHKISV